MLRDRRFYMVMPLYLAPPFFLTGLFFHQVQLAESRDWPIEALAAPFLFMPLPKSPSHLTGPTLTGCRLCAYAVKCCTAHFGLEPAA